MFQIFFLNPIPCPHEYISKIPMGWIPHPAQDLEQLWDINPFYQLLMKSMYSLSVDAEEKGGGGLG